MKKTMLMALAYCVLIAAGVGFSWWFYAEEPGAEASRVAASSSPSAVVVSAPAKTPAVMASGLGELPQSLAGTEVNCELETDASGHLQVSIGLRQCFDYFLGAVGEESVDALTTRIRAQLRMRLQEPALGEAEQVLEGYLAYLRGVADLEQRLVAPEPGQLNLDQIRQQREQVLALRVQHLSPEVIAVFFADDDAYDLYTLARLELMQNKALSAQERAQQLAELEQQLPEGIRASLKATSQYLDLRTLTDEWKQRAGSADELRQIRTSLVGEEATARLETLDQENGAWEGRMSAWYVQRDALLNNAGLSPEDRERQLEDLRKSRFGNEAERLRVQTLERIHDQVLPLSMRP